MSIFDASTGGFTGNNSKIPVKNSRFPFVSRAATRQILPSAQAPSLNWSTTAPGATATLCTSSGTTLTVAGSVTGVIYPGMSVVGTGYAAGTVILAYLGGSGGTGTYTTNKSNTVSVGVATTFGTFQYFPADQGEGSSGGRVNSAPFTYTRCRGIITGTTFPYYSFTYASNVNSGPVGTPSLGSNVLRASFYHSGQFLAILTRALSQNILVKVDDQYVSLTPTKLGSGGTFTYGLMVFSTSARRRIDVLMDGSGGSGTSAFFGGVICGINDAIIPAETRGPSCFVVGDSFVGGSGGGGPAQYWPQVFADFMGWDDVVSSGVGGTGFLATNSGAASTYRSRLLTDVVAYNPDIVIFQASVNDNGSTAAQVAAEAALCFQIIQQGCPNALIMCTSPPLSKGASYSVTNLLLQRDALKAAVQTIGGIFLDFQEYPLPVGYLPHTTTLTSGASASATALSTATALKAGATYRFADGTSVLAVSASGGSSPFSNVIDNLANAQLTGAALTEVGGCLWSGNGNQQTPTGVGTSDLLVWTDGVHPVAPQAPELMADLMVTQLFNQLYSN